MKIRVVSEGKAEFAADSEYAEAAIRAAVSGGDAAHIRSEIMYHAEGRDTDPDDHVTVTEDDGTVLWAGWLTGAKDRPAPAGAAPIDEARSRAKLAKGGRPVSKSAWRRVAEILAERMANHAYCSAHTFSAPGRDCPFCADRAAYQIYLDKGGFDYRMGTPAGAKAVPLQELPARDTFRRDAG